MSFAQRSMASYKARRLKYPEMSRMAPSKPVAGRAIVTIVGLDRVGIIAGIANALAEANVNILDISQSVMREEFFTMIMMVDLGTSRLGFEEIAARLKAKGQELSVQVEIQREDIFNAMHRV
jgi:ACT domain-containing protein